MAASEAYDSGDLSRAAQLADKQYRLQASAGTFDKRLATLLARIGNAYLTSGSLLEANATLLQALEASDSSYGKNSQHSANILLTLGSVEESASHLSKAQEHYYSALRRVEDTVDESDPLLNTIRKRIARVDAVIQLRLPNQRQKPKPLSTPGVLSTRDLAKRVMSSTVAIAHDTSTGISLGSGFFVAPYTIATNYHVIDDGLGVGTFVNQKSTFILEKVVWTDKENDLAIVRVSIAGIPLSLGDSDKVQVGDSVFAVGCPEFLVGTFSAGNISAIRSLRGNKLLQTTTPISQGSSGGPLVDSSGKVVGVIQSSWRKGQNLNFAVPVNLLKGLQVSGQTTKISAPRSSSKTKNDQRPIISPSAYSSKVSRP